MILSMKDKKLTHGVLIELGDSVKTSRLTGSYCKCLPDKSKRLTGLLYHDTVCDLNLGIFR